MNRSCSLKFGIVIAAFLFLVRTAHGQGLELRVNANSGVFSFRGNAAESTTFINYYDPTGTGYTNNPYGARGELSYGGSVTLLYKTQGSFLVGADVGYEDLRGRVDINQVAGYTGTGTYAYDATGKTILSHQFLDLYPFVGYRIPAGPLKLEMLAGLEVGMVLSASEKGSASANGTSYETSMGRKNIKSDIRPRIQLGTTFGKVGVYIGYSLGVKNYFSGYVGGSPECYSRMIRFGMSYRIK